MKQLILSTILLLGLLSTGCKEKGQSDSNTKEEKMDDGKSGNYTIDPASSQISFKGMKPAGVHEGVVPIANGKIELKDGIITGGSIDIDMTAIDVRDPNLDAENEARLESHLKGRTAGKEEDFFNVDKYPKATYVISSSTSLANDPDATHMINGTLTIKGISKPVNFKAKVLVDGNKLSATTPEFDVERTQFDIKFKSPKLFPELKDDFINDEFKLRISLNANK